MNLNFDVNDDQISDFTEQAKTELLSVIEKKAVEIIDEANRLEEARRTSNAKEITATTIQDAYSFTNRFSNNLKTPKHIKWIQALTTVSSIITGGLFDIEKMKDTYYLIIFLVVLAIAIGSSVYLIFNRK